MSKLRKDNLPIGEDTVTLYELSALSRIEYLEYVFNAKNTLPPDDAAADEKFKAVSLITLRDYAMLVALSLSQAPDENREAAEIMNDVLREYGAGSLAQAAMLVRELSGMELSQNRGETLEEDTPISLEKP
ncbi:phage minor tail protein domain-containing protein [Raoultella ornithinolytica]|uniref:Phage minor tail protein G n=1 Tax=Raoultella ornithinolytica TaxID=54291 RepID=A0A9Q9MZP9_RAOOR|nr:phage minor tail protein G [Raoultella ornithinolytica]UXE39625.1 phage minor tail protein G [Raoultella ornithinolytica]